VFAGGIVAYKVAIDKNSKAFKAAVRAEAKRLLSKRNSVAGKARIKKIFGGKSKAEISQMMREVANARYAKQRAEAETKDSAA
jgi:hypothetical protein